MKLKLQFILILSFSNLYAQLPNKISTSEKYYGLSKVWSEVKRNYVYYNRLTLNWDSLYVNNLNKINTLKNDYEYYQLLRKMVAQLKDGHTTVWFPDIFYNDLMGKPPLITRKIENKIIITEVLNQALFKKGLKRGVEITKINNIDVKLYANKNIAPYIFASTIQDFNNRLYGRELFWGLKKEKLFIEIKDQSGNLKNIQLSRKASKDITISHPTIMFKKTNDDIGILTINSFWGKDFEKQFSNTFKEVLKTKALVIDLRNNYGGSSQKAYHVLKQIAKKSFYGSTWRTRQYRPAFISWGNKEEWYTEPSEKISKSKQKRFKKEVIVLISSRTYSAAEDFLVAFKQMNRGIIIGNPTGGSSGNPIEFSLPNGGGFKICTKEETFKNGTKFVGIGILPNIEIKETVNDFINKKDSILEKALQIIRQ